MPISARYTHVDDRFPAGGMSNARVYRDTHLDREVVVKSLQVGRDRRRLLDEIRALQSIRSKRVVQIYDAFSDANGDIEGFIEELVSGPDFAASNPPKDAGEFMRAIYPLAKGIADIHDAGIVHRDIKPQNIKFDQEGCLKIFDFGLSRDQIEDAATVGEVGSIGYMAPELFYDMAGGKVYFTTAIDVYAFGVTALYLCLEKVPDLLRRRPPIFPCAEADFSALKVNLPPDISNILSRCISENPRDRPTIHEVVSLLDRYLLFKKHRALLTHLGKNYSIDTNNKNANLSVAGRGALLLAYNDLDFVVNNVTGHVYINNIPAANGSNLPGSCVIALGNPADGNRRTFITVDVSHPEVTV